MRNIEIMISDGAIGQKAIGMALSGFATGNLNSKMKQGSKPFTMKDIIPALVDYITPPLTDEEQRAKVNENLLTFMATAPGAEKHFQGNQLNG